jgi:serine phosphatase RsbU (regulator of sigma subunit)
MQLLGTSMLVLPLSARGKVVGALMCSWDEGTALPTGAQLAHLEDVARRLALSVDNALLYAERAGIASALQAGLLPPRLPSIPGVSVAARYLPAGEAMEVGGDFYDVFAAGPDTWAVVVGDVCGKGAEAAAVTAMARYTLRTASLAGPSTPSGTLALLNAAMASERVPERFLTAVLAHLRLRPDGGGTLRVVAAGHPAPLVVRADGRIEAIPAGGALLGIVTGVRWEETRVDLEPGDGVVLYTDGVTEADRRAPLEPAALAALLPGRLGHPSAAGLAESVRRVAEERAGGRLRDDVAIVALLLDRR